MRFEEALKAMREGKKVTYHEEIYWIDDENEVVRYEFDDFDGFLDTSTINIACLHGGDLMSENWTILNDELVKQIFEVQDE